MIGDLLLIVAVLIVGPCLAGWLVGFVVDAALHVLAGEP